MKKARRSQNQSTLPTTIFPQDESHAAWFTDDNPDVQAAPIFYPMFVFSYEKLQQFVRWEPHQKFLADNVIVQWQVEMLGRVIFVSHEWLGYAHPDPENQQLRSLQGVVRHLASGSVHVDSSWQNQLDGHKITRLNGKRWQQVLPSCFFWFDYAGVPQLSWQDNSSSDDATGHENPCSEIGLSTSDHRFSSGDAVNSIPAYIERSAMVLILVPVCQHSDNSARIQRRSHTQ